MMNSLITRGDLDTPDKRDKARVILEDERTQAYCGTASALSRLCDALTAAVKKFADKL